MPPPPTFGGPCAESGAKLPVPAQAASPRRWASVGAQAAPSGQQQWLEDAAQQVDSLLDRKVGRDGRAGAGPLVKLLRTASRERQQMKQLDNLGEQLRRLQAQQQLYLDQHLQQVSRALQLPEAVNGHEGGTVRQHPWLHDASTAQQAGAADLPDVRALSARSRSVERNKANKIADFWLPEKQVRAWKPRSANGWNTEATSAARSSSCSPRQVATRQPLSPRARLSPRSDDVIRKAVRDEVRCVLEDGVSKQLHAQKELFQAQDVKLASLTQAVDALGTLTPAAQRRSPGPNGTKEGGKPGFQYNCPPKTYGSEGSDAAPQRAHTTASRSRPKRIGSGTGGVDSQASQSRPMTHQDWRAAILYASDLVYLSRWLRDCCYDLPPGCARSCLTWVNDVFDSWLTAVEPQRHGCLAKVVQSWRFDAFCLFVIALNTAFAGFALETEMDTLVFGHQTPLFGISEPKLFILAVETAFLCFYIVELTLRLIVHGVYFFCNENAHWNIFDLVLVVIGTVDVIYELVLYMLVHDQASGGLPVFMRIVRIIKVGKILRGLRAIRFLDELRLMLNCMLSSLMQLFWSLTLISFTLYLFGLLFMVGAVGHLIEAPSDSQVVYKTFGTVWQSGLSLFSATTGGTDWISIYDVVKSFGWAQAGAFLFYIFFFLVALLNIITSTFLDRVLKLAEPSPSSVLKEKKRAEAEDRRDLQDLFEEMDVDASGAVSLNEFMECIPRQEFGLFLATRGIDIKEAKAFFKMIAEGKSGEEEVNIGDLVNSCMRIKGSASALDLHMLRFEFRQHQKTLEKLFNVKSKGGGASRVSSNAATSGTGARGLNGSGTPSSVFRPATQKQEEEQADESVAADCGAVPRLDFTPIDDEPMGDHPVTPK